MNCGPYNWVIDRSTDDWVRLDVRQCNTQRFTPVLVLILLLMLLLLLLWLGWNTTRHGTASLLPLAASVYRRLHSG